jgi:hypothetical protein
MRLIQEFNRTTDRRERLRIIRHALQREDYDFGAAYKDMFERSYWYRTWIIQEIFSAREISMQCGEDIISWRDLREFQKFLYRECYGYDRRVPSPMERHHMWTPLITRKAMVDVIAGARRFDILYHLRKSKPEPGSDKRPPPLHTLLFEHWDALATNPRDKVFALKGLADDGDSYDIDIDYEQSVNQIFKRVVTEYIRIYGHLDIILPKRPQNPVHNLPTWCQDWSSTTSSYTGGNAIQDAYPFRTSGRQYQACGVARARNPPQLRIQFASYGQIMTAHGWKIDRIHTHSDVAHFRGFHQARPDLFDFSDFFALFGLTPHRRPLQPFRPTELDTWYAIHRGALRRGFRAERDCGLVRGLRSEWRDYCHKKHDEFFRVLTRATMLEVEELVDMVALDDWRRARDVPRDLEDRLTDVMTSRMRRALRGLGRTNVHGGHKCFFTTTTGLMGLAPNGTRRGDVVVILQGCSLPVVLRESNVRDGCWVLVGAAYVAGFMHGQFRGVYSRRCGIRGEDFAIV